MYCTGVLGIHLYHVELLLVFLLFPKYTKYTRDARCQVFLHRIWVMHFVPGLAIFFLLHHMKPEHLRVQRQLRFPQNQDLVWPRQLLVLVVL